MFGYFSLIFKGRNWLNNGLFYTIREDLFEEFGKGGAELGLRAEIVLKGREALPSIESCLKQWKDCQSQSAVKIPSRREMISRSLLQARE